MMLHNILKAPISKRWNCISAAALQCKVTESANLLVQSLNVATVCVTHMSTRGQHDTRIQSEGALTPECHQWDVKCFLLLVSPQSEEEVDDQAQM